MMNHDMMIIILPILLWTFTKVFVFAGFQSQAASEGSQDFNPDGEEGRLFCKW